MDLGFGGYTVEGELRYLCSTGAYLMAPTTATLGTLVTLTFETKERDRAEVVGRTGRFVGLEDGVLVAIDFVGANSCFRTWAKGADRGEPPPIFNAQLQIR